MAISPEEVMQQLLADVQTLQLSSINAEGLPNISYAPYVRDDQGAYYIFISQLASHTADLLNNPNVAIMLIRDEHDTRQIFARNRLTYQCRVEQVMQNESNYLSLLDQFTDKFGNVVGVLRSLPDFILFRLTPEKGRFVKGFGQAFTLKGEALEELQHIE